MALCLQKGSIFSVWRTLLNKENSIKLSASQNQGKKKTWNWRVWRKLRANLTDWGQSLVLCDRNIFPNWCTNLYMHNNTKGKPVAIPFPGQVTVRILSEIWYHVTVTVVLQGDGDLLNRELVQDDKEKNGQEKGFRFIAKLQLLRRVQQIVSLLDIMGG